MSKKESKIDSVSNMDSISRRSIASGELDEESEDSLEENLISSILNHFI